MEIAVQSVEIDERVSVADRNLLDLAHENGVIAAVICVSKSTLQYDQRVGEHRNTTAAGPQFYSIELIQRWKRESFRQIVLTGSKNIRRKHLRRIYRVVTAGCLLNAYEDERRIQRDGAERGDRYAVKIAGRSARCDNRDPAWKSRKCRSKVVRCDGHMYKESSV